MSETTDDTATIDTTTAGPSDATGVETSTESIDVPTAHVLGYRIFLGLLIASGSTQEEAPGQFRTFLGELVTPSEELAQLLERSPRTGDGANHYVRAIKAGLPEGESGRDLFKTHDAWVVYRVFASVLDEMDAADAEDAAAETADAETADDAPSADAITTDELLRERPLEWGATEMRSLHVDLSDERRAFLDAELREVYAEMREIEEEKKQVDKRLGKQIAEKKERCDEILASMVEQIELGSVTCRWRFDWTNGLKELVRLDTDVVVDQVPLSLDEKQARLEFDEPEVEPEPAKLYNHFRCNKCGWTWQVEPTSDLPADAVCPSCDSKAISLWGDGVIAEQVPHLEPKEAEAGNEATDSVDAEAEQSEPDALDDVGESDDDPVPAPWGGSDEEEDASNA